MLIATATAFADHGQDAQLSDWLSQFGRYALGSSPWPIITVSIFQWVRRFSAPGWSTPRYVVATALFTAAITVAYVPLASALFAINHDISAFQLTESLPAVPAFSWFWDATLLIVNLGLAHAWAYYHHYELETRRAEEFAISNERLEAELTRLELELLRAQLEPHFLFNALNSIAALIRSSNADDATDALASLSELLRYAIESGNLKSVTISKEMSVAEEYLRLQKLRFGGRLRTAINISAAAADCRIPPMLLQPMLENAVQHSMNNSIQPAEIAVAIEYAEQTLRITIENSAEPGHEATGGFGLGLTNVQRRLQCLYPDSHTFNAQHIDGKFVAIVTLSYSGAGVDLG